LKTLILAIVLTMTAVLKAQPLGEHEVSSSGSAVLKATKNGSNGIQGITPEPNPFGFASCDGGTVGGEGGSTVVITSAQQLNDIMVPRQKNITTPLILYISGTLTGLSDEVEIKRTANVSILGLGPDAGLRGFGFKITDCQNIIIRNLTFSDCTAGEGDAIAVEGCVHVWIDHCSFTDSPGSADDENHDGQTDVKKGSYDVTLSWNHYQDHRKTSLLGHSKSQTDDTVMEVTYVHNWFDGTYSRHPRVRYAKVHVVNNLYTDVGLSGGYGVGSTCQAQVFVEGNYFQNTPTPTLISLVNDTEGTLSHDPAGYLKASDNVLDNSGAIVENGSAFVFDPGQHYAYVSEDPQSVKASVEAGAGAGIISIATSIPASGVATTPKEFSLNQNYPNPFNPSTQIEFTVMRSAATTLKVYDVLGREIAVLFDGNAFPGNVYRTEFTAGRLPSGVYVSVLKSGPSSAARTMLLVK